MPPVLLAVAAGLVSVFLSFGLIVALRPLLQRHALARPNARSSHSVPTPQGGGIGVVAASLGVGGAALWAGSDPISLAGFAPVALAAAAMACLGFLDDIRGVPPLLRLLAQTAAVALALGAAPDGARLLPESVPLVVEKGLALLAGLWFVNLVNFMDGVDWMTVAEVIPLAAGLVVFGLAGLAPPELVPLAAALTGAMLGFAPLNKPVARLFLGDVGSLAIGVLVGWMLYRLALAGGLLAAVILPLYYLGDATLTLLRRLGRGEKVWLAHRSHYYQRATDKGFSVWEVVTHVFVLNIALAALASVTLIWPTVPAGLGALVLACLLVAGVLRRFATPRRVRGALA